MNFSYNEKKITWFFEGKQYEYFIEGIRYASIEKKYIFVRSFSKNNHLETHTYITLKGLLLLSAKIGISEQLIIILDEANKEIPLGISNLVNIIYHNNYLYAIVIVKENDKEKNRKVIQYNIHGKKLKEYACPQDYWLYRFCGETDETIEFVIYDKKEMSWKFSLNTETGEWKKICYIRD